MQGLREVGSLWFDHVGKKRHLAVSECWKYESGNLGGGGCFQNSEQIKHFSAPNVLHLINSTVLLNILQVPRERRFLRKARWRSMMLSWAKSSLIVSVRLIYKISLHWRWVVSILYFYLDIYCRYNTFGSYCSVHGGLSSVFINFVRRSRSEDNGKSGFTKNKRQAQWILYIHLTI